MPSNDVGRLVRAWLSRRQAAVQVLRDGGLSDDDIADRLGMTTSTVRVHRHRIDTEVADAKQLVENVEG